VCLFVLHCFPFFVQTVCWSLVFPRASTARSCFPDQCIRFVFHSRLGARVGNPLPLPVSLDCVPRQDPFLPLIASGHVRLGTSVSPVLPQRFLLPIRFFFSARCSFSLRSPAAGTHLCAFVLLFFPWLSWPSCFVLLFSAEPTAISLF
jgi:hypothetical protein